MATFIRNELKLEKEFDPKTKRHYVNGVLSVLHCHHYSSLYTQLALDANETDLLKESAAESFYDMLKSYFAKHDVTSIPARVDIGCQYFAALGLGKMQVVNINEHSGTVEILKSHTDEGWMKKWGQYDKPVNYIGAGFIEALFESVLDQPVDSFYANETQSIVMGAEISKFKVIRR
jgi:predicted hydrocarbon binding protein